jgi:hypothetical protein
VGARKTPRPRWYAKWSLDLSSAVMQKGQALGCEANEVFTELVREIRK